MNNTFKKIENRKKEMERDDTMHPSSKAAILRELKRFERWINEEYIPEVATSHSVKDVEKEKSIAISKILDDTNGSWKDIAEDGWDAGYKAAQSSPIEETKSCTVTDVALMEVNKTISEIEKMREAGYFPIEESKTDLCRKCGKHADLTNEDAGTDREIERLCNDCYYSQDLPIETKSSLTVHEGKDVEELAREYSKGKSSSSIFREAHEKDFIAGYKAALLIYANQFK